jgi:trk system potassium uptake protein TrkA
MKKDIAIIGLGTFGSELAIQLTKYGHHILAIDIDEKKINNIKEIVDVAVQADISDEEVLKQLEIYKFDIIIFAMSSALESIILAITHLKKLKAKHIIGKANTRIQKEILLKIGADEVILPEITIAKQIAEKLSNPSILDKMKFNNDISLWELKIPDYFIGKNLKDLDLRKKYNINVIMKKNKENVVHNLSPDEVFQEGEIVLVVGEEKNIKKVFNS